MKIASWKHAIVMPAAVLGLATATAQAAEYKIEISLETGPNHVRNISVVKLAKQLEEASGGRLEVKVFHGASKYKGTNVPTALAQGALDMGMPGTWHLGKFIPSFNMPGLPLFYGRPRDEQYKVWDGAVGKALNERLEKKLKVKVIGRWFDLGFGQMFFIDKAVKSHADLKGLKMRAPGGAANLARYDGFGAKAIKIAWPDVPQALQRGTVDGLLTSHESVRSAKLWDAGLKHAYDDNQTFFQYVPVMSMRAWKKLPADIQKLIVDTWEANVDSVRKLAHERQNSARVDGAKHGIVRVDASPADLAAMRKKLLAGQDALIKKLRIDADLVKKAEAILATN
jgi:TRAP-type transport system periplasmic protein